MEIDKALYNDIKEYCALNSLKPREYINSLLTKAFMADKYGDRPGVVPFKQDKKEAEKAEETFNKIVEGVGGPDKYNDIVTDLIFETSETEPQKNAEKEENVGKNEETQASEPIRDIMSQEVSRKEEEPKKRKLTAK